MSSAPEPQQEKPVLIAVDDSDDVREILCNVIESENCQVIACRSGREAFEAARSSDAVGILSDIRMADGTGIDILRRLQASGYMLPLAFLSGYATVENLTLAIRLGAVDFLEKPFNNEELAAVIQRLVALGTRQRKINEILAMGEKLLEPKVFQMIDELNRQIGMLRNMVADRSIRKRAG